MSWIRHFEAESTQGLGIKDGRGRKRLIDLEHEDGIKAMIKANPNITIDELKLDIAEKYDIILGRTTVHRLMKRLSFSYITPRPRHYKATQKRQDGFKKNLREKIQKVPKKRVFFFDDARFGTHSKIGHAWLETGKRTQMPVKLGFKNFYLYRAVEPSTGEHFTLELPYVNTDCFNVFLEAFSKAYPEDEMLLIMDGAGWHRSKNLTLPAHIEFEYLPPYSPELNPVERFWEHIKRYTIRNIIHKTLGSIQSAVTKFLDGLKNESVISLCTANYLYI